jgi:hypothetical protein
MNKDSGIHINYPKLVDDAMLGIVITLLKSITVEGLKGDHYFLISFATSHSGVVLSEKLRKRYPEEMTIVLQHQFDNLTADDKEISVNLSFDGIRENVVIPYESMTAFVDPSTRFAVQLNSQLSRKNKEKIEKPKVEEKKNTSKSNVISLDQFRKK